MVSNVIVNGEPIGSLGAGEATWHTDMSYLESPPKASMLFALEVPPAGGNTYFCGMYHAYDSLPEPLRRRIEGRMLKHDGTYNSGGYLRQGVSAVDDPVTSAGAYHPLVCTHPETKRRGLYLGRRRNAYIQGLPLAESEALLDELWSIATREEFTWHNKWAIWCCGTIAAPCTGAIRSTLTRAGSCIGPKSRAKRTPQRDHYTFRSLRRRGCSMRLGKVGAPTIVLGLLCAMYFLYFVDRVTISTVAPLIKAGGSRNQHQLRTVEVTGRALQSCISVTCSNAH